jgi:ribosomal protein S19
MHDNSALDILIGPESLFDQPPTTKKMRKRWLIKTWKQKASLIYPHLVGLTFICDKIRGESSVYASASCMKRIKL